MRINAVVLPVLACWSGCLAQAGPWSISYQSDQRFVIADAILVDPVTIPEVILDLQVAESFVAFNETVTVNAHAPGVDAHTQAVQQSHMLPMAMTAVGSSQVLVTGDPRVATFSGGGRSECAIAFLLDQPMHYRLDAHIAGSYKQYGGAVVELTNEQRSLEQISLNAPDSPLTVHLAGLLGPGEHDFYARSSVGVVDFDGLHDNGTAYRARLRLSQQPILRGDLDADSLVNGADLGLLLTAWLVGCEEDPECPADVDFDGQINGFDLGLMLANWTR